MTAAKSFIDKVTREATTNRDLSGEALTVFCNGAKYGASIRPTTSMLEDAVEVLYAHNPVLEHGTWKCIVCVKTFTDKDDAAMHVIKTISNFIRRAVTA